MQSVLIRPGKFSENVINKERAEEMQLPVRFKGNIFTLHFGME
jgi:hypothetical protein